MQFMALVRATKDTEAGVLPSEAELTAMGKFNEEMVKAGIMIGANGLQPSSNGARVKITSDSRTVVDGPFAEAKELIAGYWILDVKSKEEAIQWMKRAPAPANGVFEIEIRKVFEADDFGEALTPELRAQEERMAAEMAARQQK